MPELWGGGVQRDETRQFFFFSLRMIPVVPDGMDKYASKYLGYRSISNFFIYFFFLIIHNRIAFELLCDYETGGSSSTITNGANFFLFFFFFAVVSVGLQ